jgi:hypothetical protein
MTCRCVTSNSSFLGRIDEQKRLKRSFYDKADLFLNHPYIFHTVIDSRLLCSYCRSCETAEKARVKEGASRLHVERAVKTATRRYTFLNNNHLVRQQNWIALSRRHH